MSKLEKLFSVKNEYSGTSKRKIVNCLGLKIKFKSGVSKPAYNYNAIHYVIAMLKEYGIRNIVTSPGTQNAGFAMLVQDDNFFNCYSVVDERSAAYVATGIAYETQEPVVITCTGATASRNYMSALTEAYYKKLPIIALTFYEYINNAFSNSPQFIDRSVSQNDIKTIDVALPGIQSPEEKSRCLTYLNAALSTAKYKHEPVHIDCPSKVDINMIKTKYPLPTDVWSTEFIYEKFDKHCGEFNKKNVALFIGQHNKFDKEYENVISEFAQHYNAPVFCDHTSNYKGKNKFMINDYTLFSPNRVSPDILIDLGGISCDYTTNPIFDKALKWKVSKEDKFITRKNYRTTKIFVGLEKNILKAMISKDVKSNNYIEILRKNSKKFSDIDSLPLSLPFIAYHLSKNIPNNSVLHLGILNSLRSMNFFDLDDSIQVNANVGGFGIDGALSTLVGQSYVQKNKLNFALIGDLAFFYDMNSLGIRDIKNNIRILLVNNNEGCEMEFGPWKPISDDREGKVSKYVCAQGHYKNGAKNWAESCGFKYMSANTKENLLEQFYSFCNDKCDKPIIFEVFTKMQDEKRAQEIIRRMK